MELMYEERTGSANSFHKYQGCGQVLMLRRVVKKDRGTKTSTNLAWRSVGNWLSLETAHKTNN